MRYYIVKNNHRTGPFSIEELRQLNIMKDTLVWYDGLFGWTKAGEILELLDIVSDSKSSNQIPSLALLSELKFDISGQPVSGALQFTRRPWVGDVVLPTLLIAFLTLVLVTACVLY